MSTTFAKINGVARIGLTVDGVEVLLTPQTEGDQQKASALAKRIENAALDVAAASLAMDGLQHANDELAAKVHRLHAQLEAALGGDRRCMGRVLMKPATPADWRGEVWLLDPDKQERGFGLRFSSVAAVRREHPELYPVGATADGVLLQSWFSKDGAS